MREPIRSPDERFEIREADGEWTVVHLDSDTVIARYPRTTPVAFAADGAALLVADARVEIDYLMRAAEAAARGETLVTAADFDIESSSELNPFVERYGDGDEEQQDHAWRVIHRPSKKVVATFTGTTDHTGDSTGTGVVTFSDDGLALLVDGQRVELSELLGKSGPRRFRRKQRR